MELLYVWIEEYNNIHHQGFNFSPKHKFHFEPNEKEGPVTGGTLTHEDINPNYPDNFFGKNISNITAIVGKNGSGKSSLIDFIITKNVWSVDIFCSNSFNNYIFITKESTGDELHYFCSLAIKNGILLQNEKTVELENIHDGFYLMNQGVEPNNKHNILFYSPTINSNQKLATSESYTVNISSNFLLETSGHPKEFELTKSENLKTTNPSLTAYRLYEKKKQIELLSFISLNNGLIPFECPEVFCIQILFSFEKSYLDELNIINNTEYCLLRGDNINHLSEYEIRNFLYFSLFASTDYIEKQIYNYSELEEVLNDEYNLKNDFIIYSNILSKCTSSNISINPSISDGENKRLSTFELSFKFNISSFDKDLLAFIEDKEQTLTLKKWAYHIRPFIFWDDISDGESSLLSIFARIWYEHKNLENDFTICIFDEPDTSLHPEWQQSLVNRFKSFFSLLGEKNKYHIIITSHSPIMISDLPRENIIFLDKNAEGNCEVKAPQNMDRTFGANIHSLYRSSFFMDGVMGEFAKGKIDDVIADLKSKRKINSIRKAEIRYIIDMIGEDILRYALERMYVSKFKLSKREELELKKAEINRQLLELEKHDSNKN